jgi:hypothetical protein
MDTEAIYMRQRWTLLYRSKGLSARFCHELQRQDAVVFKTLRVYYIGLWLYITPGEIILVVQLRKCEDLLWGLLLPKVMFLRSALLEHVLPSFICLKYILDPPQHQRFSKCESLGRHFHSRTTESESLEERVMHLESSEKCLQEADNKC